MRLLANMLITRKYGIIIVQGWCKSLWGQAFTHRQWHLVQCSVEYTQSRAYGLLQEQRPCTLTRHLAKSKSRLTVVNPQYASTAVVTIISHQPLSGLNLLGTLALFPGPIPSFSMLHVEKIGEPGDEAKVHRTVGQLHALFLFGVYKLLT